MPTTHGQDPGNSLSHGAPSGDAAPAATALTTATTGAATLPEPPLDRTTQRQPLPAPFRRTERWRFVGKPPDPRARFEGSVTKSARCRNASCATKPWPEGRIVQFGDDPMWMHWSYDARGHDPDPLPSAPKEGKA